MYRNVCSYAQHMTDAKMGPFIVSETTLLGYTGDNILNALFIRSKQLLKQFAGICSSKLTPYSPRLAVETAPLFPLQVFHVRLNNFLIGHKETPKLIKMDNQLAFQYSEGQ